MNSFVNFLKMLQTESPTLVGRNDYPKHRWLQVKYLGVTLPRDIKSNVYENVRWLFVVLGRLRRPQNTVIGSGIAFIKYYFIVNYWAIKAIVLIFVRIGSC